MDFSKTGHIYANSERGFSMLRKIHTDQRANLDQSTIISLMTLKFNYDSCCYDTTFNEDLLETYSLELEKIMTLCLFYQHYLSTANAQRGDAGQRSIRYSRCGRSKVRCP